MMLRYLRRKTGQSLIEYTLILAAIVVGILFMQLYVRQAVEGRLRAASDDIGEAYSAGAIMNLTTTRNAHIIETTLDTGEVTTTYNYDRTEVRGSETLPEANEVPWEF